MAAWAAANKATLTMSLNPLLRLRPRAWTPKGGEIGYFGGAEADCRSRDLGGIGQTGAGRPMPRPIPWERPVSSHPELGCCACPSRLRGAP